MSVAWFARLTCFEDILIKVAGKPIDEAIFQENVSKGVTETVRKQAEIGIDIPSDGEFSKPTFSSYVAERLSGLGPSPVAVKPYAYPMLNEEFPGFMAQYNAMYRTIWMPQSVPRDMVGRRHSQRRPECAHVTGTDQLPGPGARPARH